MKIAVTSDHAGFEALTEIKKFLQDELGQEIVSYGPENYNPNDDYPDYVYPAARAVATTECNLGIIIGGSGEGEAIAANRVRGVRCALFYGPIVPIEPIDLEGDVSTNPFEILVLSRQHNLTNMLSLSSRFLNTGEMKRAIDIWLSTPLGDSERHLRRVKKLDDFFDAQP